MPTGSSRSHTFAATLVTAAIALLSVGSRPLAGAPPAPSSDAPFGLTRHIPWDATRLSGTPEPPLPYTVEKTFTNIAWKAPIHLAAEPGSDRLVVAQAGGEPDRPSRLLRIPDDPAARQAEPWLEIPRRLVYSVCFDPGYVTNGFLYVFSNGPTGAPTRTNRITRFTVARQPPHAIDPQSALEIIAWPSSGHDGGGMAFGWDGLFYCTSGDGSSDSDTLNSGQTMDDLLGNVLRIDVHRADGSRPYSVPADNPFVRLPGARPEIWAYGLRNPWRLDIDLRNGHVWVGNNGQDLWETAHLVRPGENYGWSVYEGSHPFYLGRQRGPTPPVAPTIEHSHAEFRSLTGGVVYYGRSLPELNGAYIYGDYSSGRIWGMNHNGQRALWHRELADTTLQIAAFGVDQRGDLLIADHGGGLHRLRPAPKIAHQRRRPFPTRLSDTGLFLSTARHETDPALIPYSVNAPAWADGARSERFMAVPGTHPVGYDAHRSWNFPDGTVLMQTLSLEREPGNAASRFRVETRLLLRQQGEWAGYAYRWNDRQTDAMLVPREGDETSFTLRDPAKADRARLRQPWRFPSRADCLTCHSRQANFVLGITGAQLSREHDYGPIRDHQLRALDHIGLFTQSLSDSARKVVPLTDPYAADAPLESRVRAYLNVNCAPCHVEAGGGNSKMELAATTARERMNLIGARPQHDTFGLTNAMLVAPGAPDRSVLLQRLSRRGPGQMPPLFSHRTDDHAIQLVRDWIAGLKPDRTFVREWQLADFADVTNPAPASNPPLHGRSFAAGQAAFRDAGCVQCHRFAGNGGTVGPDLSGISQRLRSASELLTAILEPSQTVPDSYAAHEIELTNGEILSGRIEREDDRTLVLSPLAFGEPPRVVNKKQIRDRQRSALSPMPAGIVNTLSRDEILDLLAYLQSDGDSQAPLFK